MYDVALDEGPQHMSATTAILGIDLGGTEIKAVLLDNADTVRWTTQIETQASAGRDAVLQRLAALAQEARRAIAPLALDRLGLAIPGVVDMEGGRIELLTNLTDDWNGFGVAAALHELTGLSVDILNDVRAATVAEHALGAGREYSHFICVAVGTGVGGGLVLNDELFAGSRGAAGEIGHMTVAPDGVRCTCGNIGCLETLAAAPALMRAAGAAIAAGDADLRDRLAVDYSPLGLANAAATGNATAQRIFEDAGTAIGRALAGLICVLNPQAVIVGGGVAKAGETLLAPIRAEIVRRTVVFTSARGGVEVIGSPLGGRAGAIGAAVWAQSQREHEQKVRDTDV